MLILTRRVRESVLMGDDMMITVVGISRFSVRLQITAPERSAISLHSGADQDFIDHWGGIPVTVTVQLEQDVVVGPVNVAVLQVTKEQVRLGFTAPKEVKLLRHEIMLRGPKTQLSADEDDDPEKRSEQEMLSRYGLVERRV